MNKNDTDKWFAENGIEKETGKDYSNEITKGKFLRQEPEAGEKIRKSDVVKLIYSDGKAPTTDQLNALKKAETYANNMNMSKKGVYDQLTSKYGEGFDAESAQYAIDHVAADWKVNALEKAKTYYNNMHMSKSAVYDQLISEYGEQSSADEAQYAIDNL